MTAHWQPRLTLACGENVVKRLTRMSPLPRAIERATTPALPGVTTAAKGTDDDRRRQWKPTLLIRSRAPDVCLVWSERGRRAVFGAVEGQPVGHPSEVRPQTQRLHLAGTLAVRAN
jgi:hypothetical protein